MKQNLTFFNANIYNNVFVKIVKTRIVKKNCEGSKKFENKLINKQEQIVKSPIDQKV